MTAPPHAEKLNPVPVAGATVQTGRSAVLLRLPAFEDLVVFAAREPAVFAVAGSAGLWPDAGQGSEAGPA